MRNKLKVISNLLPLLADEKVMAYVSNIDWAVRYTNERIHVESGTLPYFEWKNLHILLSLRTYLAISARISCYFCKFISLSY
jgi:hypothetical protein